LSSVNAINAYRETRIRTASQGQLIIMLYDEAIKQLDIGIDLMKADKPEIEKINKALIKAQEIITELTASLDFEKGGEIASNLFSLYMFFNHELLEANLQRDSEKTATVRALMDELRGAWIEANSKVSAESIQGNSGGVNIAG
jgi:flagellar secretion chaperone FliS